MSDEPKREPDIPFQRVKAAEPDLSSVWFEKLDDLGAVEATGMVSRDIYDQAVANGSNIREIPNPATLAARAPHVIKL